MKHPLLGSTLPLAALAACAFSAAVPSTASAQPAYAGPPVYQVAPAPRAYAYRGDDDDDYYERGPRHACRAPVWDPNERYMPGQVVWRRGRLYIASSVSASVWNVNSPPEWTPNYWVPARCR